MAEATICVGIPEVFFFFVYFFVLFCFLGEAKKVLGASFVFNLNYCFMLFI